MHSSTNFFSNPLTGNSAPKEGAEDHVGACQKLIDVRFGPPFGDEAISHLGEMLHGVSQLLPRYRIVVIRKLLKEFESGFAVIADGKI